MTDTTRTQKPKPGAWAAEKAARTQPVAHVPTNDPRVVRAIDLTSREAELLDNKNYNAWKELYAPEALYIIPVDPDAEDFANTLNMVFDDARMRDLRVTRMTEGYAIAAVDSAITVRVISRYVPAEVFDTDSGSTVTLRAAQTLVAYKRGRHDIWAADVEYTIVLGVQPSEDRLLRKVVRLVDGRDEVPAAGFLL